MKQAEGNYLSVGILGYLAAFSKKDGSSYLATIRASENGTGIVVDVESESFTECSRWTLRTTKVVVDGKSARLSPRTLPSFSGFGRVPVAVQGSLEGREFKLEAIPSPLHAGNALIDDFLGMNIVAVRHDCNAWPAVVALAIVVLGGLALYTLINDGALSFRAKWGDSEIELVIGTNCEDGTGSTDDGQGDSDDEESGENGED